MFRSHLLTRYSPIIIGAFGLRTAKCDYDSSSLPHHYFDSAWMTGKEFKDKCPNYEAIICGQVNLLTGYPDYSFREVFNDRPQIGYYNTGRSISCMDVTDVSRLAMTNMIYHVHIYDDSQVKISSELRTPTIRVRKFFITKIEDKQTFFNNLSMKDKQKIIKNNYTLLKFMTVQPTQLCIDAVRRNGLALEYINNQTEELCIEAVKQNGFALFFVKNITEKIYLCAMGKSDIDKKIVDELYNKNRNK